MWLLSVDTSSKRSSVALFRDGRVAEVIKTTGDMAQGVAVSGWVAQILKNAAIRAADIGACAVVTGPGPFTGLRIGISLVKGWAEPHNTPVISVGTLEAVCEASARDGLLAPLVDARRGQVFSAVYRREGRELNPIMPVRLSTLEEFLSTVEGEGLKPADCLFVTPNLGLWDEGLAASAFAESELVTVAPELAEAAGRVALQRLERGQTGDALTVTADYVRRSDAELLWKPK